MTRINVVPVTELSQKHLTAEFFEIRRVFTHVKKASDFTIPPQYVLGKGHVKFFYNKLGYIANRLMDLHYEITRRSTAPFSVGWERFLATEALIVKAKQEITQPELWGQYTPTPEALALNRQRIQERNETRNIKPARADGNEARI